MSEHYIYGIVAMLFAVGFLRWVSIQERAQRAKEDAKAMKRSAHTWKERHPA